MGLKYKDWNSYTINCPSKGWIIKAEILSIPASRIISVKFTDTAKNQECTSEQKRLRFKLDEDWDKDSFLVFSNDEMMAAFVCKAHNRNVIINVPGLVLPDGRKGLTANLHFEKGKLSKYKNQIVKIENMKVSGDVRLGNNTVIIKGTDASGLFEWGRTSV